MSNFPLVCLVAPGPVTLAPPLPPPPPKRPPPPPKRPPPAPPGLGLRIYWDCICTSHCRLFLCAILQGHVGNKWSRLGVFATPEAEDVALPMLGDLWALSKCMALLPAEIAAPVPGDLCRPQSGTCEERRPLGRSQCGACKSWTPLLAWQKLLLELLPHPLSSSGLHVLHVC